MRSTHSIHMNCQIGIVIGSLILLVLTLWIRLCVVSDANKVYNKENIRAKVLVFEESIHEYFLENVGIYTPYNKPEEKTAPEPAVYKPNYTNGRDLKAVPSKPMVFRQIIMSIAHYHYKGDCYWMSIESEYANPTMCGNFWDSIEERLQDINNHLSVELSTKDIYTILLTMKSTL